MGLPYGWRVLIASLPAGHDKVFVSVDTESAVADKIRAGSKPDQTGEGTKMQRGAAVSPKT